MQPSQALGFHTDGYHMGVYPAITGEYHYIGLVASSSNLSKCCVCNADSSVFNHDFRAFACSSCLDRVDLSTNAASYPVGLAIWLARRSLQAFDLYSHHGRLNFKEIRFDR